MSPSTGILVFESRVSVLISPPKAMVDRSGTDICASNSRFRMMGTEFSSISIVPPTWSACCKSSITTTRCGLMRGVTVRLMPMSLYSYEERSVPELFPKDDVDVTTGRCSPTLKRASVLSVVIITGVDSSRTLLSLEARLMATSVLMSVNCW